MWCGTTITQPDGGRSLTVVPPLYGRTEFVQEAQLMPYKPARRVHRSVKVAKHGAIRYVRYRFLLVCYSNFVLKTHRF